MPYDPAIHHRRSIRLRGYDHSQIGAYFISLVTQGRECHFGTITPHRETLLNDAGRMIEHWWQELNTKFPHLITDAFVVMPNHFHGIVIISVAHGVGADLCVGPIRDAGADGTRGAHPGAPLPEIVRWFKTMTTNAFIRGVKTAGWPSFPGRLWQRNYYERVIRDEAELDHIRAYIVDNPAQWALDAENPAKGKP